MNTKDLQIEKLNLITWITQLQDSTLIEKLKNFKAKNDNTIPQWQIDENERRLEDYRKNTKQVLDFNQAMDDIEKDL